MVATKLALDTAPVLLVAGYPLYLLHCRFDAPCNEVDPPVRQRIGGEITRRACNAIVNYIIYTLYTEMGDSKAWFGWDPGTKPQAHVLWLGPPAPQVLEANHISIPGVASF